MTCLIISILSQLLLSFILALSFFFSALCKQKNKSTGFEYNLSNAFAYKRITHIIILLILAKFSNDCLFISTIYFIFVLNKLLWYQTMYIFQMYWRKTHVSTALQNPLMWILNHFFHFFATYSMPIQHRNFFNMSHIICCPFESFPNY